MKDTPGDDFIYISVYLLTLDVSVFRCKTLNIHQGVNEISIWGVLFQIVVMQLAFEMFKTFSFFFVSVNNS